MIGGLPPSRRKRPNAFIVIIVVVAALFILPSVSAMALNVLQRIVRAVTNPSNASAPIAVSNLAKWEGKERITILVLGIDQRTDEDPKTARTDMLMLLTLDPQTQSAGMLSIPRDLYVPLPTGAQDRINTAHVYGGPELALKTVEFNFGIQVHHYARINFNAVTRLIDLLGGIDVYNDQEINDPSFPDQHYGYAPFYLPAGWQHLDGATALKYARTRHGSSDFARIRRQQQVVMAVREKLIGSDAATKLLPNTPQILSTLHTAINTDLGAAEIVQLALYVKDNIPKERIAQVAIDEQAVQNWTTPEGASVLIPIREKVRELRERFFASQAPTPNSGGADASAPNLSIEPSTGRIAIQNGTQTVGLAGGAKIFLEEQGYVVDSIGDAPQVAPKTIIVNYHQRRAYVERLVAVLGVPASAIVDVYDPNNPLDALVVLGDDYVAK